MAKYRDSVGNTYNSVPGAKVPPGSRGSSKKKVHGRWKRKPANMKWKKNFDAGSGLKHRRKAKAL